MLIPSRCLCEQLGYAVKQGGGLALHEVCTNDGIVAAAGRWVSANGAGHPMTQGALHNCAPSTSSAFRLSK